MSEVYIQIGQILKNYRLKKNLSLEKISNKTKISIQNLKNIEEGEFHLIGGQFYQRSFIKFYAKALRISERKILLMFDNTLDKSNEKSDFFKKEKVDSEKTISPIITEKIPTIPLIFIASLGLIIFFLANFFIDSTQYGEKLANIEPKSNVKLLKIEEVLVNKIENIKQEMQIKQTNVNIDDIKDYKIQKDESFLKQIIAKENVWIEIKDFSENILISTILKKEEFFNLPNGKEDIIISASNAGALFIKNGNNNHTELGSSGTVLDSVDLNSLITNH